MANWEKLNKEFDDALDSMTSEDWELWASKRIKKTTTTMKTAVEWLEEMLTISLGEHHMSLFINEFNKAKKMEKEQIEDAWDSAYTAEGFFNAEKYYKETFKQE